jgi:hypothetical protein
MLVNSIGYVLTSSLLSFLDNAIRVYGYLF